MFQLVSFLLVFAAWFGGTVAIIKIDASRQRAEARARGEVDFMDRSVTPYLVLALFAGGLPLIFYFGVTRKSAKGWLMGLGVCAALFVAVAIFGTILNLGATALDRSSEHAKNVKFFARGTAACSAPLDRKNVAADPCKTTLDNNDFSFAWNKDDGKPYAGVYETACTNGRPWACAWLLEVGSFYGADMTHAAAWSKAKVADCADPTIDPSCTKTSLF